MDIAISSVIAQTEPGWELIIGDNASTDGLADVVAAYGDPRIIYHRFDEHLDTEASFNRTMRLATAEWVLPIGADDRLRPSALEAMLEAATPYLNRRPGGRPVALVLTACHRVFPDGSSAEADYYGSQRPALVRSGRYDAASWLQVAASGGPYPWNFGSAAFSRERLDGPEILRVDVGLAADTELIVRAAAYGDVVYLDEVLLDFMVRPESDGNQRWLSSRRDGMETPLASALLSALATHAAERPVSKAEWDAIHRAAARTYLHRAAQHRVLPGGRGRLGALADIARAARLRPGILLRREGATMAAGAVLLPRWALRRLSASMRDRRHRRNSAGDGTPAPGSSPP